jgi:hypothetical protein
MYHTGQSGGVVSMCDKDGTQMYHMFESLCPSEHGQEDQ